MIRLMIMNHDDNEGIKAYKNRKCSSEKFCVYFFSLYLTHHLPFNKSKLKVNYNETFIQIQRKIANTDTSPSINRYNFRNKTLKEHPSHNRSMNNKYETEENSTKSQQNGCHLCPCLHSVLK